MSIYTNIKYTYTIYYMANLTIYLPDEVEREVRRAADESNMSVSKWVADRVGKSLETLWPAEFLALAGAFPDFPEAEELRQGYGEDVSRESLD
jgi:hypothetical protein